MQNSRRPTKPQIRGIGIDILSNNPKHVKLENNFPRLHEGKSNGKWWFVIFSWLDSIFVQNFKMQWLQFSTNIMQSLRVLRKCQNWWNCTSGVKSSTSNNICSSNIFSQNLPRQHLKVNNSLSSKNLLGRS